MYCILIAATVPTLRPFFLWATNSSFRLGHGNNRYQAWDEHNYVMSRLNRQADTKRQRDTIDRALKGEADSDRSILGPGDIQRMTDINVAYDKNSSRKDTAMEWSLPDDNRIFSHPDDNL